MKASLPPTIIVPVFNAAHVLDACLQALLETTPEQCDVILI